MRRLTIARFLAGMLALFAVLALVVATMGQPTKDKAVPTVNGKQQVTTTRMVVTAYSVTRRQCGKTNGVTAIGRDGKRFRGVAADPTMVPYGSRVVIPGIGELLVDDTGGDMRQATIHGAKVDGIPRPDITFYHVDVRFTGPNARQRALAFGRQILDVQVILPVS